MALRKIGALGAVMLMLAGTPQAASAQDAAAPVADAAACTFTTADTGEIRAVLQRYGATVPDYENFCTRLNALNMGVDSNGYVSADAESTSAVVLVRLYDRASQVRSEAANFGFQATLEVGGDVPDEVLSEAYNQALGGLVDDLDAYIASVHSETERLRGLYQAGVTTEVAEARDPCEVSYRTMPAIAEAIAAHGALPEIELYPAFCENLRVHGVGILMAGDNHVIEDRAHVWTAVALYDLATGAQGEMKSFAVSSSADTSEESGAEGLWIALQYGLNIAAADSDEFIASVAEEMAGNARYFAEGN